MLRYLLPLLITACPSGSDPDTQSEPSPELRIISPETGHILDGDTLQVQVELLHAELSEPDSAYLRPSAPASTPGLLFWVQSAHAHDPSDEPEGYLDIQIGDIEYPPEWTSSFELDVADLPAGEHALQIELRWPDGHSYFPPVNDSVVIQVP